MRQIRQAGHASDGRSIITRPFERRGARPALIVDFDALEVVLAPRVTGRSRTQPRSRRSEFAVLFQRTSRACRRNLAQLDLPHRLYARRRVCGLERGIGEIEILDSSDLTLPDVEVD